MFYVVMFILGFVLWISAYSLGHYVGNYRGDKLGYNRGYNVAFDYRGGQLRDNEKLHRELVQRLENVHHEVAQRLRLRIDVLVCKISKAAYVLNEGMCEDAGPCVNTCADETIRHGSGSGL